MTKPWPVGDPALLAPVEEHEDLRAVIRKVLERHAPHPRVREVADSPLGYAPELWALLNSELGVSALAAPESRGGLGFGTRELGVVLEECGRALISEPVLSSAVLGVQALLAADDDVVDDVLGSALSGEHILTLAPDDEGAVRAEPAGEGWKLHGNIARLVHGEIADSYVVCASTAEGTGLFLVGREAAGVEVRRLTTLDPTRRQAAVTFDAAPARLLLEPSRTPDVLRRLEDLARASLACEHVGMIDRMLSSTVEHVTSRHQFGRPLGSFQVIKHRLADMLVDLERARSAARYAMAVWPEASDSASLAAAVAAAVCTDAVMRATADAVQLHGGIGFTWEHEAHYYVRRALGDEPLFGDARSARARIAELVL
ncbi:acyl-CoA dehydrogenase family protein [Saccharomonospora viridis]|uniref:Acyl-CoA dehydrogenase n=2 Tax=Saccharomonospora viridis TaxID=1852 RepID=C7MTS7_SACVD|nr:acyl-CoA dehydrogenase family protein [Saccharomonospora viridis]ACU96810.1 acyl-CoA dehydrogenase [Saccharomonospora viridis DSM 43017]KHF42989.1 acyl-CoA dehydrogenase [Saccharomonospora viridis]SFO86922.1 acyl-CoA dehydrogenase [Saccharomonospora viridis]